MQEQLFFKDVPFLQQHFPRPLKVCYMKGRNNYACRQKIYDAENSPVLTGLEEVADFEIIRDWEKTTEIGDRAEITTLPESSTAWAKIDARSELCTGAEVPQLRPLLHHPDAPARAWKATSSSSTTTCFSPTFRCKGENYEGGILPEYHAVVFDEAHEIEDVAGQYFGVSVSNYRFPDLRRDLAVVSRMKQFGTPELDRMLERLEELAGAVLRPVRRWRPARGLHRPRTPSAKSTRTCIRTC